MNNQFDELAKGLAQSVTRRQALKRCGVGLVGLALACFGLVRPAAAQNFTTLYNFTALQNMNSAGFFTNNDGAAPFGGVIVSSNTLYGTAHMGGIFGNGTVFAVNTDGTGFATLHSFSAYTGSVFLGFPYGLNSDGAFPYAPLIISGGTLYGVALLGGSSGVGTVFTLGANGSGFRTIHAFGPMASNGTFYTNQDGALPYGGVILSGNTLYGLAHWGGAPPFVPPAPSFGFYGSGYGTAFAVNTDGSDFKTVHTFSPVLSINGNLGTNGDGGIPFGGFVLSAGALYGTTTIGGTAGWGTVFKVNPDGTGFTTLHDFNGGDGESPSASLVLSGDTLYGTAGTVFALKTNGTGFRVLHSFSGADGAGATGGLLLSSNSLFGTAQYGGSAGGGTVFKINPDGTGFRTLHDFSSTACYNCTNIGGASPVGGLAVSGDVLYGTTLAGGSFGQGTVFSLTVPPPPLKISCSGPLVLECSNGGAPGVIELNVDDSSGDPVVVVWSIDGAAYQTNTLPADSLLVPTNLFFTADFSFGEHLVSVSATGGEMAPVTCSTTVQVRDTIPPQILSISATPDVLWPPNHQMVPVTVEVHAKDNCGPTTARIVGVRSNEPGKSFHGRKEVLDWVITGELSVDLKAERLGQGQGRTYTILVECEDEAGNASLGSVAVAVPHDKESGKTLP